MDQAEFVDIGGRRIQSLMLMPYQDELLQEAVGEEIALSINANEVTSRKRHTVVAIRTPKGGVNKPTKAQLRVSATVNTIKFWVAAVLLFFLTLIVAFTLMAIWWPLFFVGLLVAVGVGVWWAIKPFKMARRAFQAAAALDGTG